MHATRKFSSNHEAPTGKASQAPINQFAHAKEFASAAFHEVVRHNNDTLYSMVWGRKEFSRSSCVVTAPRPQIISGEWVPPPGTETLNIQIKPIMKVLVVYHTTYGHNLQLARAVEAGVKSVARVHAVFRRAPEFPHVEKELEAGDG